MFAHELWLLFQINLIYPFVPPAAFECAASVLARALSSTGSFSVQVLQTPHAPIAAPLSLPCLFGAAPLVLACLALMHRCSSHAFARQLSTAGYFKRRNDAVVWLSADPAAAVQSLHRNISNALLQPTSKKPFVPHLTLGEWPNQTEADAAVRGLDDGQWAPCVWNVEYLLLMSRDPDPFHVKSIVWLGTGKCKTAPDGGCLCSEVWGAEYADDQGCGQE